MRFFLFKPHRKSCMTFCNLFSCIWDDPFLFGSNLVFSSRNNVFPCLWPGILDQAAELYHWKKNITFCLEIKKQYKNWSLWLSLKINSYHCDDFHISWMDIPCKHNTGSNHWSSLTVYHCNLCLCCNTIFLCCRHICVSSGILLKWNSLIDNISVDFDSLNIT